jgi:hypothetical protein
MATGFPASETAEGRAAIRRYENACVEAVGRLYARRMEIPALRRRLDDAHLEGSFPETRLIIVAEGVGKTEWELWGESLKPSYPDPSHVAFMIATWIDEE